MVPERTRLQRIFEIGDIGGTPGDSLKICLTGAKRGLWYDFATADGGDIFSLWGINRNISGFGNILKDIAGYYGINGCEVPGTKENAAALTGGIFTLTPTAI